MAKDNSNNSDDDGSPAVKEAEAKESSLASYFTSLKLGYNILSASLKPREGERSATQSRRPMKDTPVDYLSAGSGGDTARGAASASDQTTKSDDDTSSGDGAGSTGDAGGSGDTGSTGSSSGDTGGGPQMAPAPDSGYVSFADTATTVQQDAKAIAKTKTIDPTTDQSKKTEFNQDSKDQNAKGPNANAKAAPTPGAKGGGATGPTTSPGSGGKGGGGTAPGVGL